MSKKKKHPTPKGTEIIFVNDANEVVTGTVLDYDEETKQYAVEAFDLTTIKTNKVFPIPIKDGRLVSDITFATRLKNFIKHVGKNYGPNDILIDEEWEYLYGVANKLHKLQRLTVYPLTDSNNEALYFKNLKQTIGPNVLK